MLGSKAKQTRVDSVLENSGNRKIYRPNGPLFFGSIQAFRDNFTPKQDPQEVIIDFQNCRVMDHSGIEVIGSLVKRYQKRKIDIHLRHLSMDCIKLLDKSGNVAEINRSEDPDYKVAHDVFG